MNTTNEEDITFNNDMVARYVKTKNLFKDYKALIVEDHHKDFLYVHIYKKITKLGVLYDKFTFTVYPKDLYNFIKKYEYKKLKRKIDRKIPLKEENTTIRKSKI